MAELVDAQVSGTCDRYGRGSSSLLQGTIQQNPPNGGFCCMVRFLLFVKGSDSNYSELTRPLTAAQLLSAVQPRETYAARQSSQAPIFDRGLKFYDSNVTLPALSLIHI